MRAACDTEVFRVGRLGRTGVVAEYVAGMNRRQAELARKAVASMTNEQIAALILARRQGVRR